MLIITNLQLEREREREGFYGAQKLYIKFTHFSFLKKKKKSLHTSNSKFTNDMDFWTFSFTLVLYCAN